MKKCFNILVFLLSLFFFAMHSYAHVPYVQTKDRDKVSVPGPIEKCLGFYMHLDEENDVDMFYFQLEEDDFKPGITMEDIHGNIHDLIVTDENGVTGRLLHIAPLVPACEVYQDILLTIAIAGPKQEYLLPADESVNLPFDTDDSQGVYIVNNDVQGDIWYEQYSFKSYFYQKKTDIILTKAGQYRIYVWQASGAIGDYVVEIGNIEFFGFKEIVRSAFWLEHLVYDGEIRSGQCKEQLKKVDGENPTQAELIKYFIDMLGEGHTPYF
ncbi:MAG: hypothetical protein GY874_09665 [Desulfobacteraceae bacterium]|nr:hypothetical protein [Desulfobacteraceae bacterium]